MKTEAAAASDTTSNDTASFQEQPASSQQDTASEPDGNGHNSSFKFDASKYSKTRTKNGERKKNIKAEKKSTIEIKPVDTNGYV